MYFGILANHRSVSGSSLETAGNLFIVEYLAKWPSLPETRVWSTWECFDYASCPNEIRF